MDGKIYVGFATCFSDRWLNHRTSLKENRHHNIHLQRAWNKYGEENFLFEILEEWEEEMLFCMEHYWAIMLNVHDKKYGYNIQPTHPYGKPTHSVETRQKLSIKLKGRKFSKETIDKTIATKRERGTLKHSETTKKKMSETRTGKKRPPEIGQKVSNSLKARCYKWSDEEKKKMSEIKKKQPLSEGFKNNQFKAVS